MLKLNLLPAKEKEKIRLELTSAFLLEFGIKVFILAIVFLGLTISLYFYISILNSSQKELLSSAKTILQEKGFKDIEADVSKANESASNIYSLEKEFYKVVPTLEDLISLVPKEVYLKNLSILPSKKEMQLQGFAPTREVFLYFKKSLEESQKFAKIDSPITNLLVPIDVEFSLTLTLK